MVISSLLNGTLRMVFEDLLSQIRMHGIFVMSCLDKTKMTQFKSSIPTCLQMSWCESPPLFCMTLEVASDIAQEFTNSEQSLQPHPLKHFCLPEDAQLPPPGKKAVNCLMQVLKVYMENFISMISPIMWQIGTFYASHHVWHP